MRKAGSGPVDAGSHRSSAYNSVMNSGERRNGVVPEWLADAALQRLTLWLNHVLSSEPAAMARLQAHVGRAFEVRFEPWPSVVPAPPTLRFSITPAGLLECGPLAGTDRSLLPPDLLLRVAADRPLKLVLGGLAGARPKVDLQGDSALAGDLSWLMDNLRWEPRDDLMRLFGPVVAERLGGIASGIAAGLREAVRRLARMVDGPPASGPR